MRFVVYYRDREKIRFRSVSAETTTEAQRVSGLRQSTVLFVLPPTSP